MSSRALLSVCIPTYNRAALLGPMLTALCRQSAALGDQLEIVVSDNASTDATRAVVDAASAVAPIRYFRNDQNMGSRNFLLAVERASGEYAWVLGDDDLVLDGGLCSVAEALRRHRDVDYFYVNYFTAPVTLRDRLIHEGPTGWLPDIDDCVVHDSEDRRLATWEHVFDLSTANAVEVNTSLVSSVFRREEWLRCADLLRMSQSPIVSKNDTSLDDLFPHVKILAHAMMGRAGYYVARPCSLMGQGGQEWLSDWPAITITGMNQALLLYESLGVEPRRLRRLWRSHFVRAADYMPLVGMHRHADSMQGYAWGEYLWRSRRHLDILVAVMAHRLHPGAWLKAHLPAPLFAALRGVWRASAQRAR